MPGHGHNVGQRNALSTGLCHEFEPHAAPVKIALDAGALRAALNDGANSTLQCLRAQIGDGLVRL